LHDLVQHVCFCIACEQNSTRRGLCEQHDAAGVLIRRLVTDWRPEDGELPVTTRDHIASLKDLDGNGTVIQCDEIHLLRRHTRSPIESPCDIGHTRPHHTQEPADAAGVVIVRMSEHQGIQTPE